MVGAGESVVLGVEVVSVARIVVAAVAGCVAAVVAGVVVDVGSVGSLPRSDVSILSAKTPNRNAIMSRRHNLLLGRHGVNDWCQNLVRLFQNYFGFNLSKKKTQTILFL